MNQCFECGLLKAPKEVLEVRIVFRKMQVIILTFDVAAFHLMQPSQQQRCCIKRVLDLGAPANGKVVNIVLQE